MTRRLKLDCGGFPSQLPAGHDVHHLLARPLFLTTLVFCIGCISSCLKPKQVVRKAWRERGRELQPHPLQTIVCFITQFRRDSFLLCYTVDDWTMGNTVVGGWGHLDSCSRGGRRVRIRKEQGVVFSISSLPVRIYAAHFLFSRKTSLGLTSGAWAV